MASWAMRFCAVATLLLTLGCQSLLGLPKTTKGAPLAAASMAHEITGRVVWPGTAGGASAASVAPGLYHTMETWTDVASASTVSLIDTSTNETVVTSWTDGSGAFNLVLPSTFVPASGSVYIMEAIKGLFDNAVNHNAARVRTFLEYQGNNAWAADDAGGLNIDACSTALSLIWGIGQEGASASLSPATFINTYLGCTNPAPYGYAPNGTDETSIPTFDTVYGLVNTAIQENVDPVANIGVDNGGNFTLFLSPIPLIYQLVPNQGAVGSQMKILGQHFILPVASTSVNFDYDTVDDLCDSLNGFSCFTTTAASVSNDGTTAYVDIPSSANTGPLTVTTFDGTSNAVSWQLIPAITAQASVN